VINSGILLFGGGISFLFGLAITQFIDGFSFAMKSDVAPGQAQMVTYVALAINLLIAGFFAACGYYARKGKFAIYIMGIGLYALDGLLSLVFEDFSGALFHGVALVYLISGLLAMRKLHQYEDGTLSIESVSTELIYKEGSGASRKRILYLVVAIGAVVGIGLLIFLILGN
jgi:hypothetical protein